MSSAPEIPPNSRDQNRRIFATEASSIRTQFIYISDSRQYGQVEKWSELRREGGHLFGDCEDYCITLARYCNEKRVPQEAMTLHLVEVPNVGHHIVLECEGLIADCNSDLIKSTDDEFYFRWVSKRRLDQKEWERA